MNAFAAQAEKSPAAAVGRIPVTVLTGFLGAGKTTLLSRLMQRPEMSGVAVLVNEFGEVGIDQHLLEKTGDDVLLLDSGCICCSVHGELVDALKRLSARCARGELPGLSRVVIETTGLADPVPVVRTLMEDGFVCARYECDGVIAVVDATHALIQLNEHAEAVNQVVAADRLLLTKTDLAGATQSRAVQQRLIALNPQARQIQVRMGEIDPGVLFESGVYAAASNRTAGFQQWLGASAFVVPHPAVPAASVLSPRRPSGVAHDPATRSFVLRFPGAVPWYGFAAAMGRMLQAQGDRLLRFKGILNVAGASRPLVVHGVRQAVYPVLAMERWPQDAAFADGEGRIVFILLDPDAEGETAIRRLLRDLPSDRLAKRLLLQSPLLPTRCWFRQAVAGAAPDIEHQGWVIQKKRFVGAAP